MQLTHPENGRTIDVAPSAVPVWRKRGWVEPSSAPAVERLTVSEVLAKVGDDPDAASAALAAEKATGSPRTTLVDALERVTTNGADSAQEG